MKTYTWYHKPCGVCGFIHAEGIETARGIARQLHANSSPLCAISNDRDITVEKGYRQDLLNPGSES